MGAITTVEKMEIYYIKEIGTNDTVKQINVLSESEEFDIIDTKFEHILNQHIKSQIKIRL